MALLFAAAHPRQVSALEAELYDGTPIQGFLIRPLNYRSGTRAPTVLKIHGGQPPRYTVVVVSPKQMLLRERLFRSYGM